MTFNYTYNYPQVARDSGFKLRNYKDGPLDWRLIGAIEIERLLSNQSFEQIDAVLNHLSEAPLGSILDSNILDSGIAKYFMLSQFSVQYLMFCRTFLEETVTELRESHSISQMELATLKRSLSEANNEILQLHKKITQMEAIHEVIYPCHLCTKNFVSNDALNLHISRKHSGSLVQPEKKLETPQLICKDRENDLTLINTIKLELEIKHLKERLNNAEREIKEKSVESDIKNVATVIGNSVKTTNSIGIQSNLSELKERDDSSGDDQSTSSQNQPQLRDLQDKLQEFEKWKEEQKRQNSEFLTEINNKIQGIGMALEITKNQREQQMEHEKQNSTASVAKLETLLTKKAEEIGKTTAANLEYVVNKMDMNYKEKLQQLEKELNKLNEQYLIQKEIKHIDDCKNEVENQIRPQKGAHLFKETSASESNHTFVKYNNVTHFEKNSHTNLQQSVSTSDISEDNCTDVSESLLDEENLEKPYKEPTKINTNKTQNLNENNPHLHSQPPIKLKVMTNKDAQKLTNCRLLSLGVDTKTKTLTPHLKKRFLDDLNERRNKMNQKHPQFNATRNKIKKFVDKLCSTKMPPNAKALLKVTRQVRPKMQRQFDDEYSLSEKEEAETLKSSTPLNETADSKNLKNRLERILASPIRKPDDRHIRAIVHQEYNSKTPVPMPRKRVMFDHPEIQKIPPLSPSESDESQ